ncbi:MAG TPA: DNA polymerase I, partial [Hyphomicrobiales bacterium]|nr:DNA polymerase I [Hyphomicrobiales bacterium]
MSTTEAAKSEAKPAFPAPKPIGPDDHIYLIDGSTFIFRAYFAMFKAAQARGRSFTRSDGTPVGAVMTFCNMLWKILREGLDGGTPTHVAVIFDHKGGSFRNEIYDQYKANRDEPPEELVPQFPLIREAVRAFSLLPIEQKGYEADDLIATYALEAAKAGAKVTIVSGDKDLMQLVGPSVGMFDPMPGNERSIGYDEVVKKFGVGPERVVDVQSLAGDSTDNVPGVPGIGIKTAAQLIEDYGDLDTLLEKAGEIKQKMRRERLLEFADQARMSRELVRLKTDVPVETPLEDTGLVEIEAGPLLDFMAEMEFTTLTKRVATALGADLPDLPAARAKNVANAEDSGEAAPVTASATAIAEDQNMPAALAKQRLAEMRKIPVDVSAYETVTTAEQLKVWADAALEQGYVCVDTETTSLDPMRAELVGISLSLEPGKACYIPVGHRPATDGLDFDGAADIEQIPLAEAIAILKPVFEADHVLKIGQNLKYDIQILRRNGIRLSPIDDTMLMSYALDCGMNSHGMDELSERHLGHKPISFKDVAGSGKSQMTFDRVAVKAATEYAGEDADLTLRLWKVLAPRLPARALMSVYQRLERPLIHVLANMEFEGIKVNAAVLRKLSGEFTEELAGLEKTIHHLAGESFNVASTKQLSEILFGKLGYSGGKKTGKGAWSTGANVLEDLANSESLTEDQRQLPLKLLEWRQLSKLKSTYTDTLPGFIHPETGRVHTSYALAATSTGRLASTDPNLQNIPIRTAEGRKIRTAFIAEPGHKLISADYSQIELRVLAHVADI